MMNMSIRGSAQLVLALALASLLIAFPAVTVNADPYDGKCDTVEVCVHKHASYGGPWSDFKYGYYDYGGCPGCHTYNYRESCNTWNSAKYLLNDSISSARNHSYTRHIRFYTNKGYSGVGQTVYARTVSSQVRYNDAYSSHCWDDVCNF
jgi:hypothetical protein